MLIFLVISDLTIQCLNLSLPPFVKQDSKARLRKLTYSMTSQEINFALLFHKYLIIILEESDTKLILQRAVCHTIRLMPHFCDKYFVTLPYFPVGKLLGNKSYRHTSFQKKKSIYIPITIHKKKRKSVYNKETFQHEFSITSVKETGWSSQTCEPRFGGWGCVTGTHVNWAGLQVTCLTQPCHR